MFIQCQTHINWNFMRICVIEFEIIFRRKISFKSRLRRTSLFIVTGKIIIFAALKFKLKSLKKFYVSDCSFSTRKYIALPSVTRNGFFDEQIKDIPRFIEENTKWRALMCTNHFRSKET